MADNAYPVPDVSDPERLAAELTGQIRAAGGQFILLVHRYVEVIRGSGGCFAPDAYYHRRFARTLGILSSRVSKFELTQKTSFLPTTKFWAEADSGLFWYKSGLSQGSWPGERSLYGLTQMLSALTELVDWKYCTNFDLYAGEPALELVVGDKAVADWFTTRKPGGDILYPERNPLWFQQVAEELGRPLAKTPELDLKRELERASVLQQLWELNDQGALARTQLALMKRARCGSGVYYDNGAVGVVETDDDLRIVSMPHNQRLKDLTGQIRRLLARAEELGLSDRPLVQVMAEIYGS